MNSWKNRTLALIAVLLMMTTVQADDISELSAMCAATLFLLDGVDAQEDVDWFKSMTSEDEYREQLLLTQRAIDDDPEVVRLLLLQASKLCKSLRGDASDNVHRVD